MKPHKPEKKSDASHYGFAIPKFGIFEGQAVSRGGKQVQKKESEAPRRLKIKYTLHNQSFLCFDLQVDHLKKPPYRTSNKAFRQKTQFVLDSLRSMSFFKRVSV